MQAEACQALAPCSAATQDAIRAAVAVMCSTTLKVADNKQMYQECAARAFQEECPRDATASSCLVMVGGHDASWVCARYAEHPHVCLSD